MIFIPDFLLKKGMNGYENGKTYIQVTRGEISQKTGWRDVRERNRNEDIIN
jgi:hypothetical protein